MNIRIDPEFQNKIPPLTEAEFRQLEENILSSGKIYEPIAVWNGVIVDGHNRYKIHLAHPEISIQIREMHFADKWAAFDWMYKNQLGRRNLTDEQKTYLLGKLYEARKHVVGFISEEKEQGRDSYGRFQSMQNAHTGETTKNGKPKRVSDCIAEEQGVNTSTVQRAEQYSKGLDAIRKLDNELADEILSGKKNVPKKAIQFVGKTSPELLKSTVRAIKEDKPITGYKDTREIKAITRSMSDESIQMEYTVDHLIEQMRYNSNGFINSLSNLLMDHKDLCNEHRAEVSSAIEEIILKKVIEIKERLNNGTQL